MFVRARACEDSVVQPVGFDHFAQEVQSRCHLSPDHALGEREEDTHKSSWLQGRGKLDAGVGSVLKEAVIDLDVCCGRTRFEDEARVQHQVDHRGFDVESPPELLDGHAPSRAPLHISLSERNALNDIGLPLLTYSAFVMNENTRSREAAISTVMVGSIIGPSDESDC